MAALLRAQRVFAVIRPSCGLQSSNRWLVARSAPAQQRLHKARRQLRVAAAEEQQQIVLDEGAKLDTNTSSSTASSTEITSSSSSSSSSKEKLWRWEDEDDAVRAYGVFLGVLLLGAQPFTWSWAWADLPYFISLAVLTIYIGAHRGLNSRQQQFSLKEGVLAPVFASVALFGTYLLIRAGVDIKAALDWYFFLLGSVAVAGGLAAPARNLGRRLGLPSWELELPPWLLEDEQGQPMTRASLALTDVLVTVLGIGLASMDMAAHHQNFTLNNLIACMVAADILQLVGLRSFRVAAALLLGMLAYDAFWVFGSPSVTGENVMLQVATSDLITGPTRLLFPRFPTSIGEAASYPFSLLGLGDVAIPGLLACLALRYDSSRVIDMPARSAAAVEAIKEAMRQLDEAEPGASRQRMGDVAADAAHTAYDLIADQELEQRERTQGASASSTTAYHASSAILLPGARRYFFPVLGAYMAGLGMAFAANAITHMGQPALVYLVPCTLGMVGGMALLRGEFGRILRYTDTTAEPLVRDKGPKQQQPQQPEGAEGKVEQR